MRTGHYVHDAQGHVIVDMLCGNCETMIAGSGHGQCGMWITITGNCKCGTTTVGRQKLNCKHK